jgi:putative FmdB family regulatory protein
MPIFEYKCNDCNKKFDVLHKSSANLEEVICPECKSNNNQKLFSTFSASNGSQSIDNMPPCANGNCGMSSMGGGCASGSCGFN